MVRLYMFSVFTFASLLLILATQAGGAGMEYEVNNAPAPGSGKLSTMEAFPMNQWVHVYIYHAASGDVSMFWDGRLMSRGSVPVPATGTRPVMLIGKDIAATAPVSFEGSIAHLAIWNGDVSYQAAMVSGMQPLQAVVVLIEDLNPSYLLVSGASSIGYRSEQCLLVLRIQEPFSRAIRLPGA